jgi:small GTP-binding protein
MSIDRLPWDALKVIILGNTQVGKTQMMRKYFEGVFDSDGISTIVADHYFKQVILDGETRSVSAWDTAGQDRYRTIVRSYYRGAHGIIIVYDVTSQESFDALTSWFDEVNSAAPANVPVVVVGNKLDLGQTVAFEQAEGFASRTGTKLFLTSAKTGEGINGMFDSLIRLAVQYQAESGKMTMQHGAGPVARKDKEKDKEKGKRKECC